MKRLLTDRVLLTLTFGLLLIYLLQPDQFIAHVQKTAHSLLSIAPYILLSSLVAAYLKACHLENLISDHLNKHSAKAIPLASVLAVIAPLCACSVIPVITALLRVGAPLAPVMAFWVAAPIMDPEMFVLMVPVFGWTFTTAKLVCAICTGIVAGYAAVLFKSLASFQTPLREKADIKSCCVKSQSLDSNAVNWKFWQDADAKSLFIQTLTSTLWFLLRWLSLAFLIESLLIAYVPQDMVISWLSHDENLWSYPIAALSGLPLYVNGYAAIPLVDGMMTLGMSPGVALSFMIAGGASCIPAAVALWGVVKKPVFFTYLTVALIMAIVLGASYQFLLLG